MLAVIRSTALENPCEFFVRCHKVINFVHDLCACILHQCLVDCSSRIVGHESGKIITVERRAIVAAPETTLGFKYLNSGFRVDISSFPPEVAGAGSGLEVNVEISRFWPAGPAAGNGLEGLNIEVAGFRSGRATCCRQWSKHQPSWLPVPAVVSTF